MSKIVDWVAKSVDPDQRLHSVVSDLGLHGLFRPVCLGCGIVRFYYLSTDKYMVKIFLSNQELTFFLFLEESVCFGYSLEVPWWVVSDEYPQHKFSSRNKKNIYSHNLDTLLAYSCEVLDPGQVNWNFLLILLEMRQVRKVRHGISTAL